MTNDASALFGVSPSESRSNIRAYSMPVGPWLTGPGDTFSVAALGVLADEALGEAVSDHRPAGHWQVCIGLSLDSVGTLSVSSTDELVCTPDRTTSTDHGGLVHGFIATAEGDIVSFATGHYRFIEVSTSQTISGEPPLDASGWDDRRHNAGSLAELLQGTGTRHFNSFISTLGADRGSANSLGYLHGGISLTAACLEAGALISDDTLELSSVNAIYMRPLPASQEVAFHSKSLHQGRRLAIYEVSARDSAGRHALAAAVTFQDQKSGSVVRINQARQSRGAEISQIAPSGAEYMES